MGRAQKSAEAPGLEHGHDNLSLQWGRAQKSGKRAVVAAGPRLSFNGAALRERGSKSASRNRLHVIASNGAALRARKPRGTISVSVGWALQFGARSESAERPASGVASAVEGFNGPRSEERGRSGNFVRTIRLRCFNGARSRERGSPVIGPAVWKKGFASWGRAQKSRKIVLPPSLPDNSHGFNGAALRERGRSLGGCITRPGLSLNGPRSEERGSWTAFLSEDAIQRFNGAALRRAR